MYLELNYVSKLKYCSNQKRKCIGLGKCTEELNIFVLNVFLYGYYAIERCGEYKNILCSTYVNQHGLSGG